MIEMLKTRVVTLVLILVAVLAVGVMVYTDNSVKAQYCTYWDPCTGECLGT